MMIKNNWQPTVVEFEIFSVKNWNKYFNTFLCNNQKDLCDSSLVIEYNICLFSNIGSSKTWIAKRKDNLKLLIEKSNNSASNIENCRPLKALALSLLKLKLVVITARGPQFINKATVSFILGLQVRRMWMHLCNQLKLK